MTALRSPASPELLKVWIVEDQPLYRRALAGALGGVPGIVVDFTAASAEEVLAAVDEGRLPDVVLMDIGLPGLNGIEATKCLRGLVPTARVVMLTVHEEDEKVFEAICAGASGYLLKPMPVEQLTAAVREVARGASPINGYIARRILDRFARVGAPPAAGGDTAAEDSYRLTAREREILALLVEGMTLRESAERLGVSYHTVDSHVRHLYDKLHVRSRSSAVAKALRERLI